MNNRNDKWTKAIQARVAKSKAKLLDELRRMPILEIALERSSIKSRSTYYDWRERDKVFAAEADKAIAEGEALITDMSESQLISMIREGQFPAVQLWLRQHHPKYASKLEVTAHIAKNKALTPDQLATVRRSYRHAAMLSKDTDTNPPGEVEPGSSQ